MDAELYPLTAYTPEHGIHSVTLPVREVDDQEAYAHAWFESLEQRPDDTER